MIRVSPANCHDQIVLDRERHTISRGTIKVYLSPVHFALANLIVCSIGRCFSTDDLFDAAYGSLADPPFDKTVDVHLCKLRPKLRYLGIHIQHLRAKTMVTRVDRDFDPMEIAA